ncbi:hypothetical protein DYBT9275_05975 [Dyadobacter sp. CECT 9275]|uniref:Uncharacterized protein n=2 Tax=Dyadobacter helix TaxID=2822344 RepID=A0A916N7T4_9BACT|nr:hypothetical protein DYBT9275_05975 [Dyadobacter sp. CECT 9275]
MLLLMVFSAGILNAQSNIKTAKKQKAVKTGAADSSTAETQTQGNSSGGNAAWPLATGTTGSVTFQPDTTSTSAKDVNGNAEQNGAVSGLTSTGSSSTELTGGGNQKIVSPDTADRQKKSQKRKKKSGN